MNTKNRSKIFPKSRLYIGLCFALGTLVTSTTYSASVTYPGAPLLDPLTPSAPGSIFPVDTSDNIVTIIGGGAPITGTVFGGIANVTGFDSTNNVVTMNGGFVSENVTGGWSLNTLASNNEVKILGGRVDSFIYGGWIDEGSGSGKGEFNKVSIGTGATIGKNIYGAYVKGTEGALTNTITITGGTMLSGTTIIAGGYSLSSGAASDNQVIISGGTMNNADIYGGRVNTSADVLNNMVTISGGVIGKNVYGGQLNSGDELVSVNKVIIQGGTIGGSVYGGASGGSGNVTSNEVTISGGELGGNVYGGNSGTLGSATGNTVTISGMPIFSATTEIYGGFSGDTSADVFTNNIFNINTNHLFVAKVANFQNYNFNLQSGLVIGDTVLQLTDVADLSNTMISVTLADVPINATIGESVSLIATSNGSGLNTTGMTNAVGASIGASSATGIWEYSSYADTQEIGLFFNTLLIDQYAPTSPYTMNAGNLANQHVGLTVLGDLTASDFTMTSNANNAASLSVQGTMNTSNFSATAGSAGLNIEVGVLDVTANDVTLNFNNTVAWDGTNGALFDTINLGADRVLILNGNGRYHLNTLNILSDRTQYIGHLPAMDAQINFYLPDSLLNGQTMLTLTGTADISGSTIAVEVLGGIPNLVAGDKITLIQTSGGMVATGINTQASTLVGVTRIFDFDITTDAMNLYASLPIRDNGGNSLPYRVNPGLIALSAAQLAGLAHITNGSEFIINQGMDSLATFTEKGRIGPFIALGGSSLRYHVKGDPKLDSFNVLVGAAWAQQHIMKNQLTLGAFFEGGWADYDTKNYVPNHALVKGSGDTQYLGGGLVARYEWGSGRADGIYVEGALRAGHTKTDFHTANIGFGKQASYDSSASYYGAHIGTGYQWNLTDRSLLDLSTYYLWVHQGGDNVYIAGDKIDFRSSESRRIRLSGQYRYVINEQFTPYAGLGYEYEADGKIKATTYNMNLDAPKLKGSTGIIEAGFNFTPSSHKPIQIDVDIRGYIGKRKGVSGNVTFAYFF